MPFLIIFKLQLKKGNSLNASILLKLPQVKQNVKCVIWF